jgi:hypothetical protein
MTLHERWLAFCKKYLDKWMLAFQRSPDVSYSDWKELQVEYKKVYNKDYER